MIFKDRQDAGKKIASKLKHFKNDPNVIVLGVPRGGMIVAFEISKCLNLPLDLIVARKIGAPDNPEFAIGAITEDGSKILNEPIISALGINQEYISEEIEKEKKEANRRLEMYRENRPPLNLQNKTVILADDGVATGLTMCAAIKSAKAKGAKNIIIAVPTIARDSLKKIKKEVNEVVYLDAPALFNAVGDFYQVFNQVEDKEVSAIIK